MRVRRAQARLLRAGRPRSRGCKPTYKPPAVIPEKAGIQTVAASLAT